MSDLLLAILSYAMFAAFAGGLALIVGEPALLIVTVAVLVMVAVDFWRELRAR